MTTDRFKDGIEWWMDTKTYGAYPNPPQWHIDTGNLVRLVPQREWVGLTDADIERIKLMTYEKETNADGEEQEAVNIDWLIKTTEHFCKEKNV